MKKTVSYWCIRTCSVLLEEMRKQLNIQPFYHSSNWDLSQERKNQTKTHNTKTHISVTVLKSRSKMFVYLRLFLHKHFDTVWLQMMFLVPQTICEVKKCHTWISHTTHFNESQHNISTVVYRDLLEVVYKTYWPSFIPITTTLKSISEIISMKQKQQYPQCLKSTYEASKLVHTYLDLHSLYTFLPICVIMSMEFMVAYFQNQRLNECSLLVFWFSL